MSAFFGMNQRLDKKQSFKKRLQSAIQEIRIILNQIDRLEDGYPDIDEKNKAERLADAYCDLELAMALLAVIWRKLSENQFVELSGEDREDVNALIHSNRFTYDNHQIYVHSRQDKQSIAVDHFLKTAERILDQL